VHSRTKVMLTFLQSSLVPHEYYPHGQTIKQYFYLQVLKYLYHALHCKQP